MSMVDYYMYYAEILSNKKIIKNDHMRMKIDILQLSSKLQQC